MKRILLFSILICLGFIRLAAQDHTQELFNLLMCNDFFKARIYQQKNKEQIDVEGDLFYKYRMSYFLNKLDSAAIYLDKFIVKYPDFLPNESEKLYLYNLLIDLYTDTGNYNKLVDTYNDVEQLLVNLNSNSDSIWKKDQLMALSYFRNEAKKKINSPSLEITKIEKKVESIDLYESAFITTIADFNGIPLKTVLDTGNDFYLFLSKRNADKCRFKEVLSQTDSIPLNGTMVRASYALVDSIKIGSVLFTNVPAFVLHDDFISLLPDSLLLDDNEKMQYNSFFESCDAIIGLSLLRQLGNICLDWKNKKMILNLKEEVVVDHVEPNIFLSERKLFTGISINNNAYVGFVDTGNCYSCINLNPEFYKKNSSSIFLCPQEQEKGVAGVLKVDKKAKYKSVRSPIIIYGQQSIPMRKKDDCIVWSDTPMPEGAWKDGLVGLLFLKQLGNNLKIDFVNMRITAY